MAESGIAALTQQLPTAADALAGGEAAILNAESLYESARAVADHGNFGTAVSLAVLAIEEAVKARALFGLLLADRIGAPFGLNDDTFRDILFRNHALRHALAVWQGMSPALMNAWLHGGIPQDESERATLKQEIEAARWLQSDANTAKMRGLYVDFIDGKWQEPRNVAPDAWERAESLVRPFIEETRRQHGAAKTL